MKLGAIFAQTRLASAAGWLVLAALAGSPTIAAIDPARLPPPAARTVDFGKDIQPILEANCFRCHGPDKQKGGLRLDQKAAALKGGENYSPAIKSGHSAECPFIHFVAGLVEDLRMPPKDAPLSSDQIGLLRAWIDQGAAWPDDGHAVQKTHWALQPVTRALLPSGPLSARNEIDHFIGATLAQKQLTPPPEADRRTMVRRLYFDLLGLPPTPEEVQRFERDPAPGAYEELVEQLLASPHYGER